MQSQQCLCPQTWCFAWRHPVGTCGSERTTFNLCCGVTTLMQDQALNTSFTCRLLMCALVGS